MPQSWPRRGRVRRRAAPAVRRRRRRRRRRWWTATGSPPSPRDVEMQDPPRDEGAPDVEVRSLEVPPIMVVRTTEVPAIEAERTRAEPTVGVRPPLAKEEAEEGEDEEGDGTVSRKLVAAAKLAQGLVEVSLLPRSIYEADLFFEGLSCNA